MNDRPVTLLVSNNLMFLPRIEAAAGSYLKVQRATSINDLERVEKNKISIVLIDLEFDRSIWEPILTELQSNNENNIRFVAYGPHEDEDLMNQARKLGCDPVLPKGAFVNQLRKILRPDR